MHTMQFIKDDAKVVISGWFNTVNPKQVKFCKSLKTLGSVCSPNLHHEVIAL